MIGELKYFIRLLIFWLSFFLINRILFAIYHQTEFSTLPINELLGVIPNSMPLDLSFIAYLSAIFVVLLYINSLFKHKTASSFISRAILYLNYFFILITAIIVGSEISLYGEWNTKLNYTALSHLKNPSEVFLTASLGHYLSLLVAIFVGVTFMILYKKRFTSTSKSKKGIFYSTLSNYLSA